MPRTQPLLVAEDPLRVLQHVEDDALLLGVVHLLHARGHLRLGAAVDEVDLPAPSRTAVRAASIATLPPPSTATLREAVDRGVGALRGHRPSSGSSA
jgi:hypothetical protein